jgi:phytoene synthase
VRLARALYSKILEKIEERGYDVFSGRARTTKAEKLKMAALILAGGR